MQFTLQHFYHTLRLKAIVMGACSVIACSTSAFADRSNKQQLATLQEEVARLSRENSKLKESLIASNQREEQVAKTLSRVKKRMGALGKSLLSEEKDARLLSALSEVEYLQKKIDVIEEATFTLTDSYRSFVNTALVSDPDARNQVESSIREAEAALGFRNKPERTIASGTLQQAQVVSIDQETGLVVLNVGSSKEARIGMRFSIQRGNLDIATGVVAETRGSVSGLLVQQLKDESLVVQLGDSAKILLN